MSTTTDKLLWMLFKIRPVERRRALLMWLYLLAAVSAFIMGRIIRDTLFLSRFDRTALAYNYVTVAISVALPAFVYTRVADRFRRDKQIQVVLAILIVSLLLSRALAETEAAWFYFAFYNWIEVLGAFLMIQYWTFATDVFSSREAKRLFAFIGGGGVLANVVCGVAVAGLVKQLGTENLMLVQAGLLGICLVCAVLVGREQRERLAEATVHRRAGVRAKSSRGIADDVRVVFASKHLQVVAWMTAITFISVQFIDFAFKATTREHFQGDQLSVFYGYFFSVSGVLAALIQLVVTRPLLERFGVMVTLIVLPLGLLGGSLAGVVSAGALWAATLAKGAENTFRYSFYDATMQVLYAAVPAEIRGRAKAFIDGIFKPIAIGLAGGLLLLLVQAIGVPVAHLYWVAMLFVVIWIGLVLGIKKEYVSQLMATLRKSRLNFQETALDITDQRTIEVLSQTLCSSNSREVFSALELVPRVRGPVLLPAVARLTEHAAPEIRLTALRLLGRGETEGAFFLDQISARFGDDSEQVRTEAIRSFCAVARERAIPVVRPLLSDPSPSVRAAALAGMMQHGGLDGILSSADVFKSMLSDQAPAVRRQAAWVLGQIRVRNFFQPVLELMQDSDPVVQNAAIAAAGEMQSPELLPVLIYKLGRRDTARAAHLALVRYGPPAVAVLAKVLAHEAEETAIRRQVPRILAAIGTAQCLELLIDRLGVRDPDVRWEVARAAARLRDRLPQSSIAPGRVKPFLHDEIKAYYQGLAALVDIGGVETARGQDLLVDAIHERLARNLDRIFRFLGILYPLRTIEIVFRNLRSISAPVRANAIELLDNLLEKETARLVLPILDEGAVEQKIQFGAGVFALARRQRTEWLAAFLGGDDPWLRTCALYDVGETGLTDFVPQVQAGLSDPNPLIRETSVRALSVLLDHQRFGELCQHLVEEDEGVRRYTEALLALATRTSSQVSLAAAMT
ncbi:MAG: MFS transporter [Deltaproteobacteria bacterium]|nr:MFS transporter [Deltaproteobacteria bacterium]